MAVAGAGPCAVQEPGSATGATCAATGNRSAGMAGKWGLRAVGRRPDHRMALAAGIRARRGPAMAAARGGAGGGAALHADGACARRRNFRGARRMGHRPCGRTGTGESGGGRGTPCRGEVAAWQPGGARGARPSPGSRADRNRGAVPLDLEGAVGCGARALAEAEFPASRRLHGGGVVVADPANAIHEIAGKLAIRNALLEAAGSV